MAQLAITAPNARDHIAAIAQLRWRLFVNAFRRKKSKAGIVLRIIARILFFPLVAFYCIGPILGCGFAGYALIAHSRPLLLPTLLWALSTIWIFISFSASLQPTLQSGGFDLSQLIRFPISFPLYLGARIFFSLFSFTTILGMLCLLATSIGIGIAQPGLFLWVATVLLLYGFTVFSFLRMVLLWLDRWLSQRRTREIALALFTVFSLSMQLLSSSFRYPARNALHTSTPHLKLFAHIIAPLHPFVAVLPPNLAANAVLRMHTAQPLSAVMAMLGLAAWFVSFLALYALRLRGEFHGENFSETFARGTRAPAKKRALGWSLSLLSPTITACMEKEVRYLFRGGTALVGLVTPLIFVVIFTNRLSKSPGIALPTALAYVLFGLIAALYNVFGADGPGISLYLLAPVRLRDVFLAKNLVSSAIIAIEGLLATLIVSYFQRISESVFTATLLWVIFALFANLTFGNIRSLQAPQRVAVGKGLRQPTSRSGTLLTLVVLFSSLLLCIAVIWICQYFGYPWLPALIFLPLAAAAFAIYIIVLNRIDRIALTQRDTLIEALCKT